MKRNTYIAELIEQLGGEKAVNDHIRELARPIAEKRNLDVDEFLESVCYSEGADYVTTYREAYTAAYLEGYQRTKTVNPISGEIA